MIKLWRAFVNKTEAKLISLLPTQKPNKKAQTPCSTQPYKRENKDKTDV